MRFVDSLDINLCIYEVCMSPVFNGSSVIWCFKHSNAIKIHDRITLDFTRDCHIHSIVLNFHGFLILRKYFIEICDM